MMSCAPTGLATRLTATSAKQAAKVCAALRAPRGDRAQGSGRVSMVMISPRAAVRLEIAARANFCGDCEKAGVDGTQRILHGVLEDRLAGVHPACHFGRACRRELCVPVFARLLHC